MDVNELLPKARQGDIKQKIKIGDRKTETNIEVDLTMHIQAWTNNKMQVCKGSPSCKTIVSVTVLLETE